MSNLQKLRQQKEAIRLKKKFEDKSFKDENEVNNTIAKFTGNALGIVSVLLAYTYTHKFLISNIPQFKFNTAVIGFISVLLLVFLEWKQRNSLNKYSISTYKIKTKTKYFSLIVGIGITCVSIYLSYMGSFDFINQLSKTDTPIYTPIHNIQAVRLEQKQEIQRLYADLDTDKKECPLCITKNNESKQDIQLIKAQHKLDIKELKKENKEAKKEYQKSLQNFNNKNKSKGSNLGYISLILQVIVLSCLGFTNYYDYRCYIDLDENETENKTNNKFQITVHDTEEEKLRIEPEKELTVVAGFGNSNNCNSLINKGVKSNSIDFYNLTVTELKRRIKVYEKRVTSYTLNNKIMLAERNKKTLDKLQLALSHKSTI